MNTSATGMVAQQMNMDVIANNLANVNTNSFKHMRAEFQDLMYQTVVSPGSPTSATTTVPNGIQYGLGTRNSAVTADFSQGSTLTTGNPLDLMIVGDGFFRIQRPDGTSSFTRDGSFKQDETGRLVTGDGYPLVPTIQLPTGASAITISEEGVLSFLPPGENTPTNGGVITLALFPNPAGLQRVGQNLYSETSASGAPTDLNPGSQGVGRIRSGYIEGANVSVIEEMVKMITAQRAYEINSKAIQTSDEMLNTLNGLKR